ncbi:MAG: hypothetical protein WBM04_13465 [Candidatus Korobacteraceae bacterium]
MDQQPIVLRSYKKSFGSAKVKIVSGLINDLENLSGSPTGYKIYTSEIQRCLSVGLLLAAVSVGTSLLELFIRDLSVVYKIVSRHRGNLKLIGKVARELEGDKRAGFNAMLRDLECAVIAPNDVEKLRSFYSKTRIPLAHGLVRRLDRTPAADILEDLLGYRPSIEERLEDEAIGEVRFVVRIIKKYRPWLVKRMRS